MINEDHCYSHPQYFKCSSRSIIKPMTFRIKLQPSNAQICSTLVMNTGISPAETISEYQSIGLIAQVKDDMNMKAGLSDRPLCIYTHIGVNLQTFLSPVHGFRGTISCPFWKEIPKSLAQICCCATMEQACVYRPIHPSIQAYHSVSGYLEVQNLPLTIVRGLTICKYFLVFLLFSSCKVYRT